MILDTFLTKEQIVKVNATEKQLVIRELLDRLQELGHIENKDRYYAQIIHRETLENTGIGNGFAIPHARTESLEEFVSIFGICRDEVDYNAIDNQPVRYILLSLFPTDMSTQYLYLIGMMARIFSNPDKKKLFDSETAPSKVYTLLKRETKSYFDTISDLTEEDESLEEKLVGVPSSDLDLLIRLDRLYQMYDEETNTAIIDRKIAEIKKLIDNRSLTYYERMRKKHDNPFSIVEKDSCTGCHMGIPPIYIKKVRERDGITLCSHCGRFLIML